MENNTNKKNKILKFLKRISILFLIFNITLIISIWLVNIRGKPFPKARMCMKLAEKINDYYIFPLSILGLDNPLTWPFYPIRDGLYNLGLKFYPEGEGEGQIWWTNIYFNEYKMIVEGRFIDYTIFSGKNRRFTSREKQLFHNWPNILYKNLKPLVFAKISDPEMKQDKYLRFLLTAHMALITNAQIFDQIHGDNGDLGPLTLKPEERKVFENIYKINEAYKKYAKKNEPDILNYVFSNPKNKSYDSIVKFYSSKGILTSKYRRKELSCNDPYITVFAQSHKELLDYMQNNPYENNVRYIYSLVSYYPDQVKMTIKCKNNPILKDYIKYIEQGNGGKPFAQIEKAGKDSGLIDSNGDIINENN